MLETLGKHGVAVALPAVVEDSLVFHECTPPLTQHLQPGRFGVLEPVSGDVVALSSCDAVLVPALACGVDGVRLGRGAGFYDRALAQADKSALLIGVVHDAQVWPAGSVPREPHDILMSMLATPSRLIHIAQ